MARLFKSKKIFIGILGLSIALYLFIRSSDGIKINDNYYIEQWEDGHWHLNFIDADKNSFGIVQNVHSYYCNNKYIFIKQPEVEYINPHEIRSDYFIVPVHSKYTNFPQEGVMGPLTEEEFLSKKDSLQVNEEIQFKQIAK